MGEAYFNLKRKLEELGYNNTLSVDSVPLVECILADLVQTTRSLQHYMDLSKEALMQRDALMMETEPYKCDNIKLIQENNQLHRDIMQLKEENIKVSKDTRRKIKSLTEDISKKESLITKLQHDIRDLSLRGLCAETLSSRNKNKRKDGGDCHTSRICMCSDKNFSTEKDVAELNKTIHTLLEKNNEYRDEIEILKGQVDYRDNEIVRLNILLEGGRPVSVVHKDFYIKKPEEKMQKLMKQVKELEKINDDLKKELEKNLEKQHEAMLRALSLADKNKNLQEELQKVDKLALKVEDDCNKRLSSMMNEVNFLQTRVESLSFKNSELERELLQRYTTNNTSHTQDSLKIALNENSSLQKEVNDLVELNKGLQEKLVSLSEANTNFNTNFRIHENSQNCYMKDELKKLFRDERKNYETRILDIQQKLNEAMELLNKKNDKKELETSEVNLSFEKAFIKDLNNKLCESEQQLLMLKKENDDLKNTVKTQGDMKKNSYQDIISHLNKENAELSKENISLSQQLSQYRALNLASTNRGDTKRHEIERLQRKMDELKNEIQILKSDKQEYNLRYKEAMDLADKLKRDLAYKQKEIENLEEENCSYKLTNRTGKASADQLKDECDFLREQVKRMQTDYIKEKTLANQIKNIQLETERSSVEVQNELLSVQKKLSLSKDTGNMLEKKCQELQSEIIKLKNDKSGLIDNIKLIDKERDNLVMDLDHKTENIGVLENKLKSQTYEINKLENEVTDLKRKLNFNKVNEHKVVDYESQVSFLNGEILRLTQQYDTAVDENKHLQNSLADANGALKLIKIELDKSRKDVDGLKQQLQHYVAEIRRIEELLSQKEAERSDMLEQFASLSVEANILENNNHSLESESASKTLQLQTYVSKIEHLEEKLADKDNIIDSQSAKIASMTCKINSLESEIKLITEEKAALQHNISYLKQMCNDIKESHKSDALSLNASNSDLKLYENRIRSLTNTKDKLESEKKTIKENLITTEKLLTNARNEIVELKLALQDATAETKILHDRVCRLKTTTESDIEENVLSRVDLELPLMIEDTIQELSNEDDDSEKYHQRNKHFSQFSHSSTL